MLDANRTPEYVFDTDDPEAWSREEGDNCRIFRDRWWVQSQSHTEKKVLPDGGSEVPPDQIEKLANKAESDPASVIDEVTTLADALDHPDSSVRENAVDALHEIAKHDPDAVTPLVSVLGDCLYDDPSIEFEALKILKVISKSNPKALETVVNDVAATMENPVAPIAIMIAAATLENVFEEIPEATENVVQQLYDVVSDPDVAANHRVEAADKLGVLAIQRIELLEPVLPEIFSVLSTDDPDIKERIVHVASSVKADGEYADALADHESSLRSLLNHDNETTREQAYEALSIMGVAVEPPDEIDEDSSSEE